MSKKPSTKTRKEPTGTAQALNQPSTPQRLPEAPDWPPEDNTPSIPKPLPMDLITAARHIIGTDEFPKDELQRDRLLRDALGLWQQTLHLICDYRKVGIGVAKMDPTERKEFIEVSADRSGPLMEGDETIKFITGGERLDRALPKVEAWLKLGGLPWELQTMEDLKSPRGKGAIIYLGGHYRDWNEKRKAAQNAEKGRASAKQKAAAEKKKRG